MDPVSIVVIVIVGLLAAVLVFRAFSNSRHAAPRKLKGGDRASARTRGIGDRPPRPQG